MKQNDSDGPDVWSGTELTRIQMEEAEHRAADHGVVVVAEHQGHARGCVPDRAGLVNGDDRFRRVGEERVEKTRRHPATLGWGTVRFRLGDGRHIGEAAPTMNGFRRAGTRLPAPGARGLVSPRWASVRSSAQVGEQMELLVVSDLHYTLPQLDWVMEQAPTVDAVVLAGDHLDISSSVPLESQVVVMQNYIRRLAETSVAFVCSGNHDLTARNAHDEKAAPWIERSGTGSAVVDWGRFDLDDVRITVCPWWDGPRTRDDVDTQLAADASDRPSRWIWIYHFPPDLSPVSWTGRRHIGDSDLNAWIDRHSPDLVLTGHIHDSPFHDGGSWLARLGATWVVNPGRSQGRVPAHAIIDTATGTAEWWSPHGKGHERLWEAA